MRRTKEKFFILNIIDGDSGDDTEAFIRSALDHEQILKWAYCLHDKEVYNRHDMNIRRNGAQYCWADGFPGQEKYASVQEYIDEEMNRPPLVGDKKESRWYVFISVDQNVFEEDISDWFGIPLHYLRCLTLPSSIKDAIGSLTNEDHLSIALERYRYPDYAVKANFDFREYMSDIKVDRQKERWKQMWAPAPFRKRRRPGRNQKL